MLLYTKLAPPKVPKKRSRAGCAYCKEKKKKCDEVRPQCSRCEENGTTCVYQPVRPRQRRKRDTPSALTQPKCQSPTRLPTPPHQATDVEPYKKDYFWQGANTTAQQAMIQPSDSPEELIFDSGSWTPTSLTASPITEADSFDLQVALSAKDEDLDGLSWPDCFDSFTLPRTSPSPSSLPLMSPMLLPAPHLEFCAPSFAKFTQTPSQRALVDHFCNTLSHLMVFREENGNPFQQLVLPLAHSSPTVMNSLYALASAHMDHRGIGNGEKSEYYHHEAIQGLAGLLEHGSDVNQNELLAAITLLIYYEALVQKGSSNIIAGHLRGAMSVLNNRSAASSDPTRLFLERAFRYFDVITALSLGTSPLSSAFGRTVLAPFGPLDSAGAFSPSGSVDALLGMTTTVWPVIHRLSTLISTKDEIDEAVANGNVSAAAMLRAEFETTAAGVESALHQWQPEVPANSVLAMNPSTLPAEKSEERSRMQSILNTALAYRHAAFIYLYRTIYNYPRSHSVVQRHTHSALIHCVGTAHNGGPMGALLWPLFVASSEAMDLEDRELASQAFKALEHRQGMNNVGQAWELVAEIWKRADAEDLAMQQRGDHLLQSRSGGDLWRRVSREMGVAIVFA